MASESYWEVLKCNSNIEWSPKHLQNSECVDLAKIRSTIKMLKYFKAYIAILKFILCGEMNKTNYWKCTYIPTFDCTIQTYDVTIQMYGIPFKNCKYNFIIFLYIYGEQCHSVSINYALIFILYRLFITLLMLTLWTVILKVFLCFVL